METLGPRSKLKTSRGLTYTYLHIPPSPISEGKEKKYILFLHGFPSSIYDYRYQIAYFKEKGYGIVAPELLGYGGSDKPLEERWYGGKGMSTDIFDLLSHLSLPPSPSNNEEIKIFGVGHDWGSFLLSRLHNYHPTLFSKLVFLDVGYSAPNHGLTREMVTMVDKMVMEKMGYSVFGYFLFFEEEGAGELMGGHIDSVESLFHTRDEEVVKRYMGAKGGMREWLEGGMVVDTPGYLNAEDKSHFRELFSPQTTSGIGFKAAINWYKAQLHNINAEDEKSILEASARIEQPVLLIAADNVITNTADFATQMKGSCASLRVERVDAGHWVMLERGQRVNELLEGFFEGD